MIEANRKLLRADLYPALKAEIKRLGDRLSFWRTMAAGGWVFGAVMFLWLISSR
jgi:hypothetical protein